MDLNEPRVDHGGDCIEEDDVFSSTSVDFSSSCKSDVSDNHTMQNFQDTINLYTESDFKSHFRMKRSTVFHLIELYKSENGEPNLLGRPVLQPEVEMYMFLWYMVNNTTLNQLDSMFGTTKPTAWETVNKLAEFFINISTNYMKWPLTQSAISETCNGFERLRGIPGVIGAISCTHIKIKAPTQNRVDYFNRKKYYSISMQVIVSHDKKIVNLYCGEPGSLDDATVLRNSSLFKRVLVSPQAWFPSRTFLLGDSSYPCKDWLVPPFKDNGQLTDIEMRFNAVHCATHVVVGDAIRVLKRRFRRLLHFTQETNIPFIVNLSYSACVLHNICITLNDEYKIHTQDDAPAEHAKNQTQNRAHTLMDELILRNIL